MRGREQVDEPAAVARSRAPGLVSTPGGLFHRAILLTVTPVHKRSSVRAGGQRARRSRRARAQYRGGVARRNLEAGWPGLRSPPLGQLHGGGRLLPGGRAFSRVTRRAGAERRTAARQLLRTAGNYVAGAWIEARARSRYSSRSTRGSLVQWQLYGSGSLTLDRNRPTARSRRPRPPASAARRRLSASGRTRRRAADPGDAGVGGSRRSGTPQLHGHRGVHNPINEGRARRTGGSLRLKDSSISVERRARHGSGRVP